MLTIGLEGRVVEICAAFDSAKVEYLLLATVSDSQLPSSLASQTFTRKGLACETIVALHCSLRVAEQLACQTFHWPSQCLDDAAREKERDNPVISHFSDYPQCALCQVYIRFAISGVGAKFLVFCLFFRARGDHLCASNHRSNLMRILLFSGTVVSVQS